MSAKMMLAVFCTSVVGAHADAASFRACLIGKLNNAKSVCSAPICTFSCKSELEKSVAKMDGSCCSEAPPQARVQCIEVVTHVLVPKLKAVIAQKCPAMEFDLMFNAMPVDEIFSGFMMPNATSLDEAFSKSSLATQVSQGDSFLRTIMVAGIGCMAGAVSMFAFLSNRRKLSLPLDTLG